MNPITIAGAGIAGLTLGRCLAQRGIPYTILEQKVWPPGLNYGITLHPWAYQPLLNLLQVDEASFRKRTAVDGGGSISGGTLVTSVNTTPGTFRCHRGRLHEFLQQGQDVRWDHKFRSVETTPQKVIVSVVNKQAVESDVLIASDGFRSPVRRSLAPAIQLKMLPFVVVHGQRVMTFDRFEEIMAPQMQGLSTVQCRQEDVVFEISIKKKLAAPHFRLSYTYSRPARPEDPLLFGSDKPVEGAKINTEEFYTELQEVKGLGQAYKEMFDVTNVRRNKMIRWLMQSTMGTEQEIQDLADRGVLLVGDAMHAMPILGGEGANYAMKDGIELAEHIATHGPQGIKTFSSSRYADWKKAVEDSEQRLVEMHSPEKASL